MAAADFGQASRARPSLSASAERCQLQECGAGSRGEGHVNVGLNDVRSGDNEPPPNGLEETEILMGISPRLLCQMDSWS
jgi:hypothetical protein